ncbi:cytochrome P450 [Suillus subalutaceus]|uniref:cytochrome P450 n=1 Tax=Suillus subalutaceus TaxID=48586 RepID=UPI001B87064D|nr:cytochrome P450 [Suillus subalutaceus]KAG1874758.1 cytochrome P450 [Suillus subalutaceus]
MLTLTYVAWLNPTCLVGIGVYLLMRVFKKKNPAPYPPGPPGLPLVGNVLDIPQAKPWLTFAKWGKMYGEISHVEVLGQHTIVLNSVKTAMDMLDNKSTVYSDRPVFPMAGELVGFKDSLPLLSYGGRFRQYRKNFHRVIGSRAALDIYRPIMEIETHRFLKRVLTTPDQLQERIRHTAGAVILRISYGYEVKESSDPFINIAERAHNRFSQSIAPGAFMVNYLPFLAKVPEWLPGAGFKRLAREWHEIVQEMAAGDAPMSCISAMLEGQTPTAEEHDIARWSAVSLYGGGSDTTVSAIYSLFLAMTLFPDVQKKAQAEIDAVVGPDRLPSLADRASLPYIEALAKEVLRWNVVTPIGLPHRVTEDDVHDGYYIPKGSIIIPNLWFMLHNPETYSDPSQFNPERFLANDGKKPETEPRTICFGFGRRICTGLLLAESSIWISAAMSLAVFDISKVVENGIEITPEVDPSSLTISHPKPFKCSIRARSAKAIALVQQDANY